MLRVSDEEILLDLAMENPEMEGFAMWDIDLGAMIDPKSGEPVFPELDGAYTPLWAITSNLTEGERIDREATRALRLAEDEAHAMRVAERIHRVAMGLPTFSLDLVETPLCDTTPMRGSQEEWADFWGDENPVETGYVRRARV